MSPPPWLPERRNLVAEKASAACSVSVNLDFLIRWLIQQAVSFVSWQRHNRKTRFFLLLFEFSLLFSFCWLTNNLLLLEQRHVWGFLRESIYVMRVYRLTLTFSAILRGDRRKICNLQYFLSMASSRSCSSLRLDDKERKTAEMKFCHVCGTREGSGKSLNTKFTFL